MRKRDLRLVVRGILDDVRREGEIAPSAIPSVVSVLRQFLGRDLLREVGEPVKEECRTYWLTLRGGRANSYDPLELVSSLDRSGVVSHFSALLFHDLTDIRATDHFLTAPQARPVRRISTPDGRATSARDHIRREQKGGSMGPKTGTRCFSHAGVTYRLRHSAPELIFGFSVHWIDDQERVKVFDLERALLDAVQNPACNGDMRGVIEAWEKGAERIREERLMDLLQELGRMSLWYRAGALADYVGRSDVSEGIRESVPSVDPVRDPLPLFWNRVQGSIVNPWNVIVPW